MFSKYLRVLGRIKQEHLHVKSSPLRAALKPDLVQDGKSKKWKSLTSRALQTLQKFTKL